MEEDTYERKEFPAHLPQLVHLPSLFQILEKYRHQESQAEKARKEAEEKAKKEKEVKAKNAAKRKRDAEEEEKEKKDEDEIAMFSDNDDERPKKKAKAMTFAGKDAQLDAMLKAEEKSLALAKLRLRRLKVEKKIIQKEAKLEQLKKPIIYSSKL